MASMRSLLWTGNSTLRAPLRMIIQPWLRGIASASSSEGSLGFRLLHVPYPAASSSSSLTSLFDPTATSSTKQQWARCASSAAKKKKDGGVGKKAAPSSPGGKKASSSGGGGGEKAGNNSGSVALQDAQYRDEIAADDPIFRKPVGAVEGTGWGMVIAAGLAVAFFGMYNIGKEFLITPPEMLVFNSAVDRVLADPELSIYLGNPVDAYSLDAQKKHRIYHSIYNDDDGLKHCQVHGHVVGPRSSGTLHADMVYRDGSWIFDWMYVDVGPPYRKRVVLEHQHQKAKATIAPATAEAQ